MLVRNKKKEIWPDANFRVIVCSNGIEVLVSPQDYDKLILLNWTTKKSFYRTYVGAWTYEKGKRKFLVMHRHITRCRSDLVVHHVNHNTLDNRRENLQVMTFYEHKEMHSYR